MNSSVFVENLVAEIHSKSQNRSKFFDDFNTGILSDRQLQKFTKQYYWWSVNFVDSLIALALNLPASLKDVKLEIIKTIYSEYGYGKSDLIHSNLLKKFGHALGLNEIELDEAKPLKEIEDFTSNIKQVCLTKDYREAIGLSLVMEVTALEEFEKIYNGLKKYNQFSAKDLIFFSLHCKEEKLHSEWLTSSTIAVATDDKSQYLIKKGAMNCLDGWEKFWVSMYNYTFSDS